MADVEKLNLLLYIFGHFGADQRCKYAEKSAFLLFS